MLRPAETVRPFDRQARPVNSDLTDSADLGKCGTSETAKIS